MRIVQRVTVAAFGLLPVAVVAQDAPVLPPEEVELSLENPQFYAVPPRFAYPQAALRDDIEGRCLIAFTIDEAGVPQDIQPDCDHPVFIAPARAGVAGLRMMMGGQIVAGARFRLPVSFRIPL